MQLQLQIAFAVVLIRSKPQGFGLKGYLSSLRDTIASLTNPSKAHAEEDITFYEDITIQTPTPPCVPDTHLPEGPLIQQPDPGVAQSRTHAYNLRKRKQPTTKYVANVRTKRRKVDTPANSQSNIQNRSNAESDALHVPDQTSKSLTTTSRILLLRLMFDLSRYSRQKQTEADELTRLIQKACELLVKTLNNTVDNAIQPRNLDNEQFVLNETCMCIKRVWSLIIMQLCPGPEWQRISIKAHLLVQHLVSTVRSLLERLSQYCHNRAAELITSKKSARRLCKRRKKRENVPLQENKLFKHNCSLVTKTLTHIVAEVNKTRSIYTEVFEAVTCLLIKHSSKRLLSSVLLERRVSLCSTTLQDLQEGKPSDGVETALSARLEAPYLACVLKGLVTNGSNHNWQDDVTSAVLGADKEAYEQLRGVLLDSVFSDRHEGGKDSSAKMGVRNPLLDELVLEGQIEDNWVLGQVWELLGWDILLEAEAATGGEDVLHIFA